MKSSKISGFYKLTPEERLKIVKEYCALDDQDSEAISSMHGLKMEQAEHMIENVIGGITLPVGIAVNFLINGKDYLIPMAIEEPSVVAAASNAAGMTREKGGFTTTQMESIMIGQIQVLNVKDPQAARTSVLESRDKILELANSQDKRLLSLGGGAKDLNVKVLETITGPQVIVELFVDCKDAMGANAVNTMSEAVAPLIESLTNGKVLLKIISNLATKRLAKARAVFSKEAIGGEEIVDGIVHAYAFAQADPYRASTHNKGIMNGISAVALACGQDTRAIEAGAHSYANKDGRYSALTTWEKDANGDLVGSIEIPMAVGLVGGSTASHPVAKACRKILGVSSASEMGSVIACVGLAQNLAALRALASEGIQKGHMKLHARNIAVAAGASGDLVEKVASKLVEENNIRVERARELVQAI
ncbi:MAG: hydroxymethylglutaryl-CoA reductase, degradative [Thaumarchaeota archaeon]|nr:hydroxymethylglutaryl-CoA reductase, degradative [Nitrososphaerota archaeon]